LLFSGVERPIVFLPQGAVCSPLRPLFVVQFLLGGL
jgi:hypothetical protein